MSEMQDQVAAFEGAMAGVDPGSVRPPQQKASNGRAACASTLTVDGQGIQCLLVETHEGPHENDTEQRSWARQPTSADVPVPTDAQKAIAGSRALVAKHESEGGKVTPVGDNAERLFGEDLKREPLEQIAEDAKAKADAPQPPTREAMNALLQEDSKVRATACRKAIAAACEEYDCQLLPTPVLEPNPDGTCAIGAVLNIRPL